MALKDLTNLITPSLQLVVGDRTYDIAPPSKEDGAIMLAINMVGVQTFTAMQGVCEVCGRSGEADVDPQMAALVEANRHREVGELSLGDQYERMCADLDGPLVSKLELYALYYWTLGEKFADQWASTAAVGVDAEGPKGL